MLELTFSTRGQIELIIKGFLREVVLIFTKLGQRSHTHHPWPYRLLFERRVLRIKVSFVDDGTATRWR